jgi:hypothetical protein
MDWPLTIQGRVLHESDVEEIQTLLRDQPQWGRTRLSVVLCEHWNWRRSDGQLKDIACREFLRKLEYRGLITLRPRQRSGPQKLPVIADIEVDRSIVDVPLSAVQPIELVDARGCSDDERLFNYLLKAHHYLSFSRPVGQNMKSLVRSVDGVVLGCLLFGAAAWKCQDRDRFIGWNVATREANVNRLTNNTRFLILPWIRVPCLASHVLSQLIRRLSVDWIARYGSEVLLVETFVDTSRYVGTCYRAANWHYVGQTKGRTRQDRYTTIRVPVKDIYLYPLRRDFRNRLCS